MFLQHILHLVQLELWISGGRTVLGGMIVPQCHAWVLSLDLCPAVTEIQTLRTIIMPELLG